MTQRDQVKRDAAAPWLDQGMFRRGEIALVQPFRGVVFFVPVSAEPGIASAQTGCVIAVESGS